MRIYKQIEFSQEVAINLTAEDILSIFLGETGETEEEKVRMMLSGLNDIACFLKGIPSLIIDRLNNSQKKVISQFLREQSLRFEPVIEGITILEDKDA